VGGYDRLVQWIAQGVPEKYGAIHLNTVAREVHWTKGHVVILTAGGVVETFEAKRAVVTVPLGVLKATDGLPGALRFTPPLAEQREALTALEMGNVVKVMLHFRERFWDTGVLTGEEAHRGSLASVGFIHAHGEPFPTWWTANPFYAPVLTAWAAGPSSDALQGLSAHAIADRAIETAGRIFRLGRTRVEGALLGWYYHDWRTDPYSRGAYSYLAKGGMSAQATLASPIQGTLFFAGEALERRGHNAMVHGALSEGARVAQDVLDGAARE
jgi:monoamine oxidase